MLPAEQYAANLKLVAAKNEVMASQLDAMPLTNIQMAHAIPTEQWAPLCHPTNPIAETEKDAENLYSRDKRIFVLLGSGIGYFAVAMAKRLKPYQRMAVFELDPIVYKTSMFAVNLEPLLSQATVESFVGQDLRETVKNWWLTLKTEEKLKVAEPLRSGYTNNVTKAAYDALGMICGDMLRYHMVGLATWNQYGKHICDNDVGNTPEFASVPGLEHLTDAWKDKPAICIAAGPSLKKDLPILLKHPALKKVGVIAVGTLFAALRQIGHDPDMVTTIDFQRLNWTDQFINIPLDDAPSLVYLHSTYPSTVRRWPGSRFINMNSSDYVEWLKQFGGEVKADASHVQTVAHLSLHTALVLGANPIILLGQDLSMPIDDHHAPGARVQDRSPNEDPNSHLEVANHQGEKVWTRHSFLSMQTVFHRIVAQHPNRRIINSTSNGLAIEGAEYIPLENVLNEFDANLKVPEKSLRDIASDVYKSYTPKTKWRELESGMSEIRDNMIKLMSSSRDWLDMYNEYTEFNKKRWTKRARALMPKLIDIGNTLTSYPLALSMVVVRRFELVEQGSDIPLPDGTSEHEISVWQIERIKNVAQAMLDEGDHVIRAFNSALKRLRDVMPGVSRGRVTPEMVVRLLARESFSAAEMACKNKKIQAYPRLLMQLARHRQEYGGVIHRLGVHPYESKTLSKCKDLWRDFYHGEKLSLAQAYTENSGNSEVFEANMAIGTQNVKLLN
jgi:hypothetical protein